MRLASATMIRNAALGANYLSSFVIGLSFGGIVPLLALILERRGVAETIIGANAAMASLGVICVAPFVPWVIKRCGLGWAVCDAGWGFR